MITEKIIKDLAGEWLKETGKFLVSMKLKPGNKISLFIDGDSAVTIDDCVRLSRYIELKLDRNTEDYELQVSSCGADQPLLMPRQYLKHEGRQIRVTNMDGKQISGTLEKCTLDGITLRIAADKKTKTEETTLFINFADIKESKIELSFKNKLAK